MEIAQETQDLPEGVELSATLYLYSESKDISGTVTVGGLASTANLKAKVDNAVAHMAAMGIEDWRPMTREEIAEYKRSEEGGDDEDEEGAFVDGDYDDFDDD